MKLSRSSAYAIQALLRIADNRGRPMTGRELASELSLPLDYLHKVLRRLVCAMLLESARGEQGGFRLARQASHITLFDVVEAIDGHLTADDAELRGRLPESATEEIHRSLKLACNQLCSALQLVSIERLLAAGNGAKTAVG